MSAEPRALSVPEELGLFIGSFPRGDAPKIRGLGLASSDKQVAELLSLVSALLDVNPPAAAASQFTKWYSRSLTGALYLLSVEQKAALLDLGSVVLSFPGSPRLAVFSETIPSSIQDAASRQKHRDKVLHSLFARNLDVLFRIFSKKTGIRTAILWENAAVYIHYFYRNWLESLPNGEIRMRVTDDYEYIVRKAPPSLFGSEHSRNPFSETGGAVRSTCCLRNMLPDGNCCKGCPLKK